MELKRPIKRFFSFVLLSFIFTNDVYSQQCNYVLPKQVYQRFGESLYRRFWHDITPTLDQQLREYGWTPYKWDSNNFVYGDLRADAYWIQVKPRHQDELQNLLFGLINDYQTTFANLGNNSLVLREVGWPPSNYAHPNPNIKRARQVGDIVPLDIYGPDNGAVAYTDIRYNEGYFSVITVDDPRWLGVGSHPVNGSREWGYVAVGDGSYYVYTVSLETATLPTAGAIGVYFQDSIWHGLMNDIYALFHNAFPNVGWMDTNRIKPSQGSYMFLEWFWKDRINITKSNQTITDVLNGMQICFDQRETEILQTPPTHCVEPITKDAQAWCEYGSCNSNQQNSGVQISGGGAGAARRVFKEADYFQGLNTGNCKR